MKSQNSTTEIFFTTFDTQAALGAVLGNPSQAVEERVIYDPKPRISYRLIDREHREARLNPNNSSMDKIQIRVPPEMLVNDGCRLCPHNILLQIPNEIILLQNLNRELWGVAPNISFILPGHQTIMTLEHRPQSYGLTALRAMLDIVEKTDGQYSVILNGPMAGASQPHMHLQASPYTFPITYIRIQDDDVLKDDGIKISFPDFYTPVIVIEGDREVLETYADQIASEWIQFDTQNDLNILVTKRDTTYRVFIFLRDKTKLTASPKVNPIATFELSGIIVMSNEHEREAFKSIDLAIVRHMFEDIAPSKNTIKDFINQLQSR